MREIKFRGKRKDNGEWVHGNLVVLDYHNSIDYVEAHQIVLPNGHTFEVIPETVGEFTGLHDKKGKEIFEGDMVKGLNEHKGQSEVFYGYGQWQPFAYLGIYNGEDFEVIGNVWENPELLGKESK